MSHEHRDDRSESPAVDTLRIGWILAGFLVVVALLMLTEHRTHVLVALYWLLPLACMFMHMFMHRGHHRHGGGKPPEGDR